MSLIKRISGKINSSSESGFSKKPGAGNGTGTGTGGAADSSSTSQEGSGTCGYGCNTSGMSGHCAYCGDTFRNGAVVTGRN